MAKSSQNKKNVHAGHRDRMRNRYLKVGIDGFGEHEMLEFILFHSIAQIDTNELAHALISRFGSLDGVLNASVEQLTQVKGIGKNSAVLIKFISDLKKTDLSSITKVQVLDTSEKIDKYVRPLFTDFSFETVYAIALDKSLHPICNIKLSEGGVDMSLVSPAKLARSLINCGAEAVILAHNHPTGFAVPSVADVRATSAIRRALDSLAIKLIDHIIVIKDDSISFRDSGNNLYTTFE